MNETNSEYMIAVLEDEIASLRKQNNDMKLKIGSLSNIEILYRAKKAECVKLIDENNDLKNKVANLASDKLKYDTDEDYGAFRVLTDWVEELQGELESQRDEYELLKSDYEELRSSNGGYRF